LHATAKSVTLKLFPDERGYPVNMEQAIALYAEGAEIYHRARLAVLRGETLNMRSPPVIDPRKLEGCPQKPKVVWILRPPGYSGRDEYGYISKFCRTVVVDSGDRFKRHSGRSIKGRNTLRHGRVNWSETIRRYDTWEKESQEFASQFFKAIDEINDQWYRWVWDQNDEAREYVFHEGWWLALTRYKSKAIPCSVTEARDKSEMHRSRPELFRSFEAMLKSYPIFEETLKLHPEQRDPHQDPDSVWPWPKI